MSKYVYFYHGGAKPSEQEKEQIMLLWSQWFDSMGGAVIDGGNAVGMSSTIHSDGHVSINGGSNPASGYSLIDVDNEQQAIEFAKHCPILAAGGSIELAPALLM